ncbi:MAG TPA: response regulator [Chthoniobacteraceae bacterium]|jgi:CheY-like chemotaxis protein|nr:response regulator [Chthoniobacteraceae bacterium]
MLPLSYESPLAILIVDDEPAILQVLETILREDGHDVLAASNGVEALRLFREKRSDVVLTDRAMPGMTGDTLAAAIKQLSPLTPVVMVTGTPPRAGCAAVDAIVRKPFARGKLVTAISQALAACTPAGDSPTDAYSAAA